MRRYAKDDQKIPSKPIKLIYKAGGFYSAKFNPNPKESLMINYNPVNKKVAHAKLYKDKGRTGWLHKGKFVPLSALRKLSIVKLGDKEFLDTSSGHVYNSNPCGVKRKNCPSKKCVTKRKNPTDIKKVGGQVTLIKTTKGSLKPSKATALYGLKDGSVFVKGLFGRIPKGTVTRIEYMDEAKAKREGFTRTNIPWRHDFSKERVPLKKVRGGLLMQAVNRPLWGMR